jgi:hypothetical protein
VANNLYDQLKGGSVMSEQVLQDPQTVTTDGERVQKLPEGVTFHEVKTQLDERGSLCEITIHVGAGIKNRCFMPTL